MFRLSARLEEESKTTILASNDIQADFCFVGLQKFERRYVVLWLDELAVLNRKAEVKAISGNSWSIPTEVKHFETKLFFAGKCNFSDKNWKMARIVFPWLTFFSLFFSFFDTSH